MNERDADREGIAEGMRKVFGAPLGVSGKLDDLLRQIADAEDGSMPDGSGDHDPDTDTEDDDIRGTEAGRCAGDSSFAGNPVAGRSDRDHRPASQSGRQPRRRPGSESWGSRIIHGALR